MSQDGEDSRVPRRNRLQEEHNRLLVVEANLVRRMKDPRGSAGYRYTCLRCGQVRFERLRAMGHAVKCGQKKTAKKRGKGRRILKCNICHETATTEGELSKHRRTVHAIVSLFKCTVCKKTFGLARNFKRHVKSHKQGDRQLRCNICGKTFGFLCNLERHKQSDHLQESPFPCNLCDLEFSYSSSLKRHNDQFHVKT